MQHACCLRTSTCVTWHTCATRAHCKGSSSLVLPHLFETSLHAMFFGKNNAGIDWSLRARMAISCRLMITSLWIVTELQNAQDKSSCPTHDIANNPQLRAGHDKVQRNRKCDQSTLASAKLSLQSHGGDHQSNLNIPRFQLQERLALMSCQVLNLILDATLCAGTCQASKPQPPHFMLGNVNPFEVDNWKWAVGCCVL